MDSLNAKIKQIIDECNLTPSKFADEIGVQRSSISHILANRNKPSFDIIAKINRWDPSYTLDFFMEGEEYQGNMVNADIPLFAAPVPMQQRRNDSRRPGQTTADDSTKKVERILVFYTDKTFSEFRPT